MSLGYATLFNYYLEFEILHVASVDNILSIKRITKAVTRLHGCAVWSVPLFFAHNNVRFSRIKTHII